MYPTRGKGTTFSGSEYLFPIRNLLRNNRLAEIEIYDVDWIVSWSLNGRRCQNVIRALNAKDARGLVNLPKGATITSVKRR